MTLSLKFVLTAFTSMLMMTWSVVAMKGQGNKDEKTETTKNHVKSQKKPSEDTSKSITLVPTFKSFKDFKDLSVRKYVELCMPNQSEEYKKVTISIFLALLKEDPTPITEDDSTLPFKPGLVRTESGYSFPPIMEVQGPFLQYCATGSKRILDIGAGSGNDTIPLLLCPNVQVVAVDIHNKQLEQLRARVSSTLGKLYPDVVKKYFSTFKRDFADKTKMVPETYVGAFQGANINKVPHFLTGSQFGTLVCNVATMLCDEAILSLTVATYLPNSREGKWIAEQEKQGLTDPGLLYYDRNGHEYTFVERKQCNLPSPGHKVEFLVKEQPVLRTGRYFHTLDSLKTFLDPHFDIIDHHTVQVDAEDIFLTILAKKKRAVIHVANEAFKETK